MNATHLKVSSITAQCSDIAERILRYSMSDTFNRTSSTSLCEIFNLSEINTRRIFIHMHLPVYIARDYSYSWMNWSTGPT